MLKNRSRSKSSLIALVGVLIFGIGITLIFNQKSLDLRSNANIDNPVVVSTPAQLALTQNEILNSGRGFYKWQGGEMVPMREGVSTGDASHINNSYDSYDRFIWRNIETSKDVFDFTAIDAKINEAKSRGGTFSFGLYTVCSSWCPKVSAPDYIAKDSIYNGWYSKDSPYADYNDLYIPDWNNAAFLARMQNLLNKLGERYNNNPAVGPIEIRMYGDFGEWHMFAIQGRPSTVSTITLASKQRIIDYHIQAFSQKRLVQLIDEEAIMYILNKSTNAGRIGWRGDCLGLNGPNQPSKDIKTKEHFRRISNFDGNSQSWQPVWDAGMKDIWKVAPVITEFCPAFTQRFTTAGLNETTAILNQTKDYHVSLIGNGNANTHLSNASYKDKWNAFTAEEKANLINAGKTSGFRYTIKEFRAPTFIAPNIPFQIQTNWQNLGVAPTYDNWNVAFTFTNSTDPTKTYSINSSVVLKNILSTETASTNILDTITLPSTLPVGTYSISISIKDPQNIRKPMALSISGNPTNYILSTSTITNDVVSNADVTATNTPTITSTPTPTTLTSIIPTATPTIIPTTSVAPTSTTNIFSNINEGGSYTGTIQTCLNIPSTNVRQVDFYLDKLIFINTVSTGSYCLGGYNVGYDTRKVADGFHQLTAIVTGYDGKQQTYAINFTTANKLLSGISQNQTVAGNILVCYQGTEALKSVAFYIDNNSKPLNTDSTKPYCFSTDAGFDTKKLSNGSHKLRIISTPTRGAKLEITTLFTVAN